MVNKEARFANRLQAGAELAEELARYLHRESPVVLAIPPDGVPVAVSVAVALAAPLDLVVSQRIVAPRHDEETLGAITPDMTLVVNSPLLARLRVSDSELERLSVPALGEAQRALGRYRGNRAGTPMRGRTVVLVDDSLTTGYTMLAAVMSARKWEPARVMVAVPVAAIEAIERVGAAVDDLLSLEISTETDFSVARYYTDYAPLTDNEVAWTLDNIWREKPPAGYSETF